MDIIELDRTLNSDVKTAKSSMQRELQSFIVDFLRDGKAIGNQIDNMASKNQLITLCSKHLLDTPKMLTSVIIQSTKMVTFRIKKSWGVRENDIYTLGNPLRQFLRGNETTRTMMRDFENKFDDLLLKYQSINTKRPILLLADSMFLRLKPTNEIFPISHSGENIEDLHFWLGMLQPKLNVRAIVLNHGLNHSRNLGNPEHHIKAVHNILSNQFPGIPLYHLSPPLDAPDLKKDDRMVANVRQFSSSMQAAGFLVIKHPKLHAKDFGDDHFHYRKSTMMRIAEHVVDTVEG